MPSYRVIVENEQAADFVLKEIGVVPISFYTTSPWLIEKKTIQGNPVCSLENDTSIQRMSKLGSLGYSIAESLSNQLEGDDSLGGIRGKPLFGSIQRTFFVLSYKADLMRLWVDDKPGKASDLVVGNPEPTEIHSFNPSVGRFDTLFAALALLAQQEGCRDLEVVHHIPMEDGREHVAKMESLGQSVQERLLSLLNMPLNVFRYKFMKRRLGHRRITPNPSSTVPGLALVLRDCELLEETVPFLRDSGWNVAFDDLAWLSKQVEPRKISRENGFSEDALLDFLSIYQDAGVEADPFQRAALRILLDRVSKGSQYAEPLWEELNAHFDAMLPRNVEYPTVFLTNALTSPGERLIFQYAHQRRIPLFSFEHGITAGLSQLTTFQTKHSGMHESHYMFFLTPCAMEHHKRIGEGQGHAMVSGAPLVLKRVKWKVLQKLITRFMLRFSLWKRVVLYATLATQNNMIYGPGGQNDAMYYRITSSVIQDVFSILEDSCVLKLYPTNRYLDPDPFSSLVPLPHRTKRVQYFEFRYLRALADVLIVDSAMSTLGWAWSAHIPLIYLDLPSNPLLTPVAEAFDRAVFRIDCTRNGWVKEVRELLLLPHQELIRRWNRKREQREEVEERYIFGPKGRAGKRAAELIIRESMNGASHEGSGSA